MTTEKNRHANIKLIPTPYVTELDPPLTRSALQALLEKRQAEHYEACAKALDENMPMPDRKAFELDRIEMVMRRLGMK